MKTRICWAIARLLARASHLLSVAAGRVWHLGEQLDPDADDGLVAYETVVRQWRDEQEAMQS